MDSPIQAREHHDFEWMHFFSMIFQSIFPMDNSALIYITKQSRGALVDGDFYVCSFSKSKTVSTDYGKGILRVSTKHIGKKKDFKRNQLVEITTDDGRSIYAIARGSGNLQKNQISLEYDQRIELGLEQLSQTPIHLKINKSGPIGWFLYVIKHPDPITRLMGYFTIYVTAIFTLVSIIISIQWS